MLTFFAPVLALMARILIAFSVTFLVPGIWAWFEDHRDLQWIWLAGFGIPMTGILTQPSLPKP